MPVSTKAENRSADLTRALVVHNVLGTDVLFPTAVALTNSTPIHVLPVDLNGNAVAPAAAPVAGQATIATTGTAIQLTASSTPLANGIILVAKSTNAANLHVGASGVTNTEAGAGTGVILEPGKMVLLCVNNANVIYVNGTINDVISYIGA